MEVNEDREYDVILHSKLDGARIPAHRDVLSTSSSFFEAMFSSGMKEANKKEITLDEIPGLMLNEVVKYCYTGHLTIDNMEILAETTDFFQLNGEAVLEKCLRFMSENICVENCMNFVRIAEKHDQKKFLNSTMEFIDLFFVSLYERDTFDEISVQTLENILKRNTLEVSSEKIVFDAILKWYKHDKLNRKKYLPELLKLVHLPYLDRAFIASFFFEFSTQHDCFEVIAAASDFLTQDDNTLYKKRNRRMSDKIVAYNEHTIRVYSEKTKKWFPLMYVQCAKSKALAFEDRCLDGIVYYSPVYLDKYLSSLMKIKLTTRQTVFEKKILSGSVEIMNAQWIEGDNSKLYVVGHNDALDGIYLPCPVLSCFQYNPKENDRLWRTLPKIRQLRTHFHIAYVDRCLYVLGAAKKTDYYLRARNNEMPICRFNFVKDKWESCRSMNGDPIEYGVGVINDCIYVVDSVGSCGATQSVRCYNPKTSSWQSLASLNAPCKNMKVCGTNKFLYVVEGDCEPPNTHRRVLRYDPIEDQWKELDSLNEVNNDFNLLNASHFD